MTQLVELQQRIDAFADAGYKIYAISYDSPEAIARFADKHAITFDMLSDEDSEVIRRFGILNTLIEPEDGAIKHPSTGKSFYGIPFPGTYVVDDRGVVVEKLFDRHYATRASVGTILDTALGKVLAHEGAPQTEAEGSRVKVTAFLSDSNLKLEVKSTLHIRLEVDEGLHLYGEPLPDGFIPTKVVIKPIAGVRTYEPVYPPTTPKKFEALNVTLNTFEDTVDIGVPMVATAEVRGWGVARTKDSITLEAQVTYQACSDTACYAPETVDVKLDVPLDELIPPER